MPIRTKYYTRDEYGVPTYTGPAELEVLGEWVTADIQLSPYAVLEAIDLVRTAQAHPSVEPEDLDGNAHSVSITPQGVKIENLFVEQVRGEFGLDQTLEILLDFWEYCRLAIPDKIDTRRREYLNDHGRDPLSGISGL